MLKNLLVASLACVSIPSFAQLQVDSENLVNVENTNRPVYSLEATEPSGDFNLKRDPTIFLNIDEIIEHSCSLFVSSKFFEINKQLQVGSKSYINIAGDGHTRPHEFNSTHIRSYHFDTIAASQAKVDSLGKSVITSIKYFPEISLRTRGYVSRGADGRYTNEISLSVAGIDSFNVKVTQETTDPKAWIFKSSFAEINAYVDGPDLKGDIIQDFVGNYMTVASKDHLNSIAASDDLVLTSQLRAYHSDTYQDFSHIKMDVKLVCKDFHQLMAKNRAESLKRLQNKRN